MDKVKTPLKFFHKSSSVEYKPSRVFCVGANYKKHVEEMGLPGRESPFYFMKPREALVQGNGSSVVGIDYPPQTKELDYEVELVVLIGKNGSMVPKEKALEFVSGLGVGIDFTRRDIQRKLRDKNQPWELSKAFEQSAPVGPFISPEKISSSIFPLELNISLSVNGKIKQQANTRDMIFSVSEIISDLSTFFTLLPGDLVFTGTPQGVGPVFPGDVLEAKIDELPCLSVAIQ